MSSLARRPIGQLFQEAASTEPAPGGGSVTALCGMLGVALVLKALRISIKHRDDGADFEQADASLAALAEHISADADADAESFSAFIAALRLPKGSPGEAEARKAKLQEAAVASTEAGLAALDHAVQAMAQARRLGSVINQTMAPDLVAGLALLGVLHLNAVHNAEANLASVKAADVHTALSARLERLKTA